MPTLPSFTSAEDASFWLFVPWELNTSIDVNLLYKVVIFLSNKRPYKEHSIYKKLRVITNSEAWKIVNGKSYLRTDKFFFVGKVSKDNPHIVTKAFYRNEDNNKSVYVDDFCHLNKNTKTDIVKNLFNSNKNSLFLVVDKELYKK